MDFQTIAPYATEATQAAAPEATEAATAAPRRIAGTPHAPRVP